MAMFSIIRFGSILVAIGGITWAAPQNGNAGQAMPGPGNVMAVPPPLQPLFGPGVCIEEGATGFINDTCQTDGDCFESGSMICSSKRCQCASGYSEDPSLPKGSKKRTCVPLPSLLSPCTTICQKPYECKSGSGMGEGMPVPFSSNGKTCQCPGKSRYVNGVCDGGCKAGQRLGSGGQCVARCTKDQVLIDNECKKLANLGEVCADNVQCTTAFSSCQDGKCSCASGFTSQGSKCVPKTYSCPFGDPLKKGDSVVVCEGSSAFPVCMGPACPMLMAAAVAGHQGAAPVPQSSPSAAGLTAIAPASYKTDSCPSTHYCYNYDLTGSKQRGHCCPKSTAKCPVGDPHPTATCNGAAQMCPFATHNCVNIMGGSVYDPSSQVCCPKPCQGYDKVYVKDQCLPMVEYGDGCLYDEQCQRVNGVCSGGKCTCGPKAKLTDVGFKYCSVNCDWDEIAYGAECKSRLKLGDSCSPESTCPSGAYCNKKGVCACNCGFQKINEKFCAPPAYCPTAPTTIPTPPTPIDIKKATFCKLDGDGKPPLTIANSCPAKSFCAAYTENMGLCCPQPDPFCPDGAKPTSKKNCHSGEQVCGGNEFCNTYFFSATSKPGGAQQQGSVCCPISGVPIIPMAMAPGVAAGSSPGSQPKGNV